MKTTVELTVLESQHAWRSLLRRRPPFCIMLLLRGGKEGAGSGFSGCWTEGNGVT
jgi:hypothetical protein